MKVLVLGGGGREHALCWALGRSPEISRLLCAPGNPGIADLALCVALDPTDVDAVVALVREEAVDLVVVGPEAPLVAGVTDAVLAASDARVFGPSRAAARIEGSKAFAKDVMAQAGVPTGRHVAVSDEADAMAALQSFGPPFVVKADGLAAGKGVTVAHDLSVAHQAVHEALVGQRFGAAGRTLVIEEYLDGPEMSLFGICDGIRVVPLAPAQDFKRIGEGGRGPNTGGMGAYSPVPAVDSAMVDDIVATMMQPVLDELRQRGTPFVGVLYAGLVLTTDGPRVLEYNARFGDPETQAVLPRLTSDLATLLWQAAGGDLRSRARFGDEAAVTVVAAAPGYPSDTRTGQVIEGLEVAASTPGALVFHAGTALHGHDFVTAGGRVLSVTGLGGDLDQARRTAYHALTDVRFEGMQVRGDIAAQPTTS